MYGLLLPSKSDSNSPAAKKKKPHPQISRDAHVTNDDITTMTSEPSSSGNAIQVQLRERKSPRGGRREEGRRNRQSVVVETEMKENGSEIQVCHGSCALSSAVFLPKGGRGAQHLPFYRAHAAQDSSIS